MLKNIAKISSVLFLLVFFTQCKEEKKQDLSTIQMISSDEMEELIKSESNQLVDVRTEKEFEAGHIAGAHNIVYDENFDEKMASLDKSKPVVVYCHSGGRSKKCAAIMKKAGFTKIYDLKGGITQWVVDKKDTIR